MTSKSSQDTFVIASPTLSPSSLHLAFDASSWGAVHSPSVQVRNCVSPTHIRCPSIHVPLDVSGVSDGPAADAVEVARVGGPDDCDEYDAAEVGSEVEVSSFEGRGEPVEIESVFWATLIDAMPVEVDVRPVVWEIGSTRLEEVDPPPLPLPVTAEPLAFRGFPSQGCRKRLSAPSGRLTESPGYGYAMATCCCNASDVVHPLLASPMFARKRSG